MLKKFIHTWKFGKQLSYWLHTTLFIYFCYTFSIKFISQSISVEVTQFFWNSFRWTIPTKCMYMKTQNNVYNNAKLYFIFLTFCKHIMVLSIWYVFFIKKITLIIFKWNKKEQKSLKIIFIVLNDDTMYFNILLKIHNS